MTRRIRGDGRQDPGVHPPDDNKEEERLYLIRVNKEKNELSILTSFTTENQIKLAYMISNLTYKQREGEVTGVPTGYKAREGKKEGLPNGWQPARKTLNGKACFVGPFGEVRYSIKSAQECAERALRGGNRPGRHSKKQVYVNELVEKEKLARVKVEEAPRSEQRLPKKNKRPTPKHNATYIGYVPT